MTIEPVVLQGEHVVLEPLRPEHSDELVAAASDGRLWELWYTSVPTPEAMAADGEWLAVRNGLRSRLARHAG